VTDDRERKETAELLGTSGQSLKSWASDEQVSGYHIGDGITIPRRSVETYVA
jgi:hypothetical protein